MKNKSHAESETVGGQLLATHKKPGICLRSRLLKYWRTLIDDGPTACFEDLVYSYHYYREQHRRARAGRHFVKRHLSRLLWGKSLLLHPSLARINEELLEFGVHEPLATVTYQLLLKKGDHFRYWSKHRLLSLRCCRSSRG